MFFSEALGQGGDFSHRFFKWGHLGELRADVHLYPTQVQVL